MAKAPKIGHGKSRLAADIGRVQAWRINRALQAGTLRAAAGGPWRAVLAAAPDRDADLLLPGVWPAAIARTAQGPGDLGARLARAFAALGPGPGAVVGVDCPAVDRAAIAQAFAALRQADWAVGPAVDGGFWILAGRRLAAAIPVLSGVRWSTAQTLADLERGLPGRIRRLPIARDIDTAADWRAVQNARTKPSAASWER